ncbi:Uncharacterized protein FWK35_00011503 [Aphis craccivora]|uniref:Uncharacterized protein n=1 Tax=Aphis craccivora TaxID=307492 RepID=A0A6G0YW44_APHCR|nr:Uncharacterized protein FWK35_00011503 [Aphis craccivora]
MERKIGNETAWIMPTEDQTSEHNNKWISRATNLLTVSSVLCEYGEEKTMDHLLKCNKCSITYCNAKDLIEANQNAINMAQYWSNDL